MRGRHSLWWIVFVKEIIENARDRRTLISALLYGPLVGPILFAGMITMIFAQQREAAEKRIDLPVIGADHAPALVAFLRVQGVQVLDPPTDPAAAIAAQRFDVILRIPDDFGNHWREADPARVELLFDDSRQSARASVDRAHAILEAYGRQTGALRLQVRGVSPSVATPLVISQLDFSTPQSRAALLLTMLPYFLILSAFIGGMYLAIDTTAGERERQSLEPLMLTPVLPAQMMLGKLLATAFYSAASLLMCVAAMAVSLRFVPSAEFGLDLQLPVNVALRIAGVALPLTLLAAGAQTIIASFAKSFREAQTYVQLLILVPAIPSVILAITPLQPQTWMYALPLMSQSVIINQFSRGDLVAPAMLILSMASTLLVAALLASASIRQFRRENFIISS